MEEMLERQSLS
jgi:hypothetical protein